MRGDLHILHNQLSHEREIFQSLCNNQCPRLLSIPNGHPISNKRLHESQVTQ